MKRPLTERERAVLDWLLEGAGEPASSRDLVVAEADATDPTISFAHKSCEPGVAEVATASVTGSRDVVVLLRAACGELESLEYLPIEGPVPSELPSVDSLALRDGPFLPRRA